MDFFTVIRAPAQLKKSMLAAYYPHIRLALALATCNNDCQTSNPTACPAGHYMGLHETVNWNQVKVKDNDESIHLIGRVTNLNEMEIK